MSTNNISRSPQSVEWINCFIAPLNIGPLQSAAFSESNISPIEFINTPLASTGLNNFFSFFLIIWGFVLSISNKRCWFGP